MSRDLLICSVVLLLALAGPRLVQARTPVPVKEQEWLELELEAFNRLEKWLRWNEYEKRLQKDDLNQLKDNAIRYVNGGTHATYRAAFRALLLLLEQTPEQSRLLFQGTPAFGASEFGRSPSLYIVRFDGTLAAPPEPLLGSGRQDRAFVASRTFGTLWVKVAKTLKADQPISRECVVGLQEALTEWKNAAQGTMASAPQVRRSAASAYLNSAHLLVCCLTDETRKETLSQFLRDGNVGFAGGTVGDFVQHVLNNRLPVRYGSRPQLILANLTHDIVRQVDTRMAVLEDHIERYKSQNPAHNAALKELLIAAAHCHCRGYGWCGGGTCHGGCGGHGHQACHVGVRPSIFNFPQGEQPAGLQSQAYARPLPQSTTPSIPLQTSATELQWLFGPAAADTAMTEQGWPATSDANRNSNKPLSASWSF